MELAPTSQNKPIKGTKMIGQAKADMKPFKLKAPDYFQQKMDEAETLLEEYRTRYPQLKLQDGFAVKGEKEFKKIEVLEEPAIRELNYAKAYFESLWQAAWKEIYLKMPAVNNCDLQYKKGVITASPVKEPV